MIKRLVLNNFKIHKHLDVALGNLVLLTGINSSGKSSVIQSLLLLRQTALTRSLSEGLNLSDSLCNVGFVKDVFCQYADTDEMSLRIETENQYGEWRYKISIIGSELEKNFLRVSKFDENILQNCSLFSKDFQYISVARWEPKESYPIDTKNVEINKQFSIEKGRCELIPHYLYYWGKIEKTIVPDELCCPNVDHDLLSQVSAWECRISENIRVIPIKEGSAFTLKYAYHKDDDVDSAEYAAFNVGSGLSYALPIIVALLTTEKGGLVIIENPEIHLHARGQAELARLITLAAQYGIQVIVETHSEHILNGILVASKCFEKGGKGINKDSVSILHFSKDTTTQLSTCQLVTILGNGELDIQPNDFFDQTEKDSNFLMGLSYED
ncbi:MAG: AAA family ATPase [Bacteroidaceae bacterium]|nr:AAA family ATPase [Bacteroidaceae bacterium]